MAFTSLEKVKIRTYLGFPVLYLYLDVRFESALALVGNDADATSEIQSIITRLDGIETQLEKFITTKVGLNAASNEDATFYEGRVLQELRKEGRRLVGKMSVILGVGVVSDVFSENGYGGDDWSRRYNQMGGGTMGGICG